MKDYFPWDLGGLSSILHEGSPENIELECIDSWFNDKSLDNAGEVWHSGSS